MTPSARICSTWRGPCKIDSIFDSSGKFMNERLLVIVNWVIELGW
jgi:hypothetical protein